MTGWSWTFGDGGTSTARSPSRTYVSAGTYAVGLTVTDNGGATQQRSVSVTVGSTFTLSVTGKTDATKQYMTLLWSGATGATVDVYRDGAFLKNDLNDGKYVNSRSLPGAPSYVYKVCQEGRPPSARTRPPSRSAVHRRRTSRRCRISAPAAMASPAPSPTAAPTPTGA